MARRRGNAHDRCASCPGADLTNGRAAQVSPDAFPRLKMSNSQEWNFVPNSTSERAATMKPLRLLVAFFERHTFQPGQHRRSERGVNRAG